MKNIFICIILLFAISCGNYTKIELLNRIFLNINLEKGTNSILKNSNLKFTETYDTNVPEGIEPHSTFFAQASKNYYFKSKIKNIQISIIPSSSFLKNNYQISQIIIFEDFANLNVEYENLKKDLIPLSEDYGIYDLTNIIKQNIKEEHVDIKLKEKFGSGFINIYENKVEGYLHISYNTDKEKNIISLKK